MTFPFLTTATEVLTDDLLPLLPIRDVLALAATCRALHVLICSNGRDSETIWKRRIRQDFRFPIESTARQHGWLELYKRIRHPNVYLWGEAKNARMALSRGDPRVKLLTRNGGIPVPARIQLPVSVVDIVAGGWSFHALTVTGEIYHWGQLDGNAFAPFRHPRTPVPRYAHPGTAVLTPTHFQPQIPPITRLVSGRKHVLALDEENHLWTWANWAEAGLLSWNWLNQDCKVEDIATGWQFSAVLLSSRKTHKREMRIWWQNFLSPALLGRNAEPVEGSKGCYRFSPRTITLPDLPAPGKTFSSADQRWEEDEFVVKMAAGDNFLIVLSNLGKVYRLDLSIQQFAQQDDEDESLEDDEDGNLSPRQFEELENLLLSSRRGWEYLPNFSEPSKWHTADKNQKKSDLPEDQEELNLDAKITFISASFRNFFAISKGVVLQGTMNSTEPIIKPEIQNRSVIRVECGDYHFGALTSSGRLYTFGEYSNGALGHGIDNSRLPAALQTPQHSLAVPQKVGFYDPLKNSAAPSVEEYCFNVAMAGWASSALTVDLREIETLEAIEESESQASCRQLFHFTVADPLLGRQHSGPAVSRSEGSPMESQEGISNNLPPNHNDATISNPSERIFDPTTRFRIGYPGRGIRRDFRGIGGRGGGRGGST